jgi:hypothetical protein
MITGVLRMEVGMSNVAGTMTPPTGYEFLKDANGDYAKDANGDYALILKP